MEIILLHSLPNQFIIISNSTLNQEDFTTEEYR